MTLQEINEELRLLSIRESELIKEKDKIAHNESLQYLHKPFLYNVSYLDDPIIGFVKNVNEFGVLETMEISREIIDNQVCIVSDQSCYKYPHQLQLLSKEEFLKIFEEYIGSFKEFILNKTVIE